MKKRVLWFVALLSSTLFAASDAQIIEYYKSKVPVADIKIDVVTRKGVEGISGMDFVTIKLSDGKRTQNISIFTICIIP